MSSAEPSHYSVLGVQPDADAAAVRKAFRSLSRQHHPDVGGDRLVYERITVAYAVLIDPHRRSSYDAGLGLAGDAAQRSEQERQGFVSARTSPAAPRRNGTVPKPVRTMGKAIDGAPDVNASIPLHGQVPKRGVFDRTREARTAGVRELLRLVNRELPAARAVLGIDVPGAGRHDAVLFAGSRAVLIDILPTPDTSHAWDGSVLRVNGKVATIPNVASAAHALERAAGGTRAEGLAVLVTQPQDAFRPVVDNVGPVHATPGPANVMRASQRVCTFLAGGLHADAVDLGVLSRLLSLATHR